MHNTSRSCFLLVGVLGHKIWIATLQLSGRWQRSSRVLGSAHFQVLTLNLHLLKHKRLSGFFCRADIYKRVVTITCNPTPQNWVPILENLNKLTKSNLLQQVFQVLSAFDLTCPSTCSCLYFGGYFQCKASALTYFGTLYWRLQDLTACISSKSQLWTFTAVMVQGSR